MRFVFLLATTLAATTTFAAPSQTPEATATVATHAPAEQEGANHIYFSTNFMDLSKGYGNVGADFMVSDKIGATLRFRASSDKEDVTKNGEKARLTVDRTSYALGVSYFVNGINNKLTFIVSPALAFGAKKDALDVETQNGLSVKTTALMKIKNNLAAEIGVRGDNLEDGRFIGDLYAGLGYLF